MAILFKLEGAREASESLRGVAGRMRKPGRALRFIGEEMLVRTQRRMRRGLDVHGRPFKRSRRAERDGGQTLADSGRLASSTSYDAREHTLDLYSSDKRARVHQVGETIRPKGGKRFLTIPLRARGGSHEGPGLSVRANRTGARARHFENTFFRRVGGRLFLFQKTGQGGVRALFLLVPKVTLPKREWLGYSRDDLGMAEERLGRHVEGERS